MSWAEDWCALLREFHAEDARENGQVCSQHHYALCPGWEVGVTGVTAGCPTSNLGVSYETLCRRAVNWARRTGRLGAAPCGSSTCDVCFVVLDRSLSVRGALDTMKWSGVDAETVALHAVIFAAMKEKL